MGALPDLSLEANTRSTPRLIDALASKACMASGVVARKSGYEAPDEPMKIFHVNVSTSRHLPEQWSNRPDVCLPQPEHVLAPIGVSDLLTELIGERIGAVVVAL